METRWQAMSARVGVCVWFLLAISQAQGQSWPESIEIEQGGKTTTMLMDELREQADVTFRFYDPYLGREVDIRGFELDDWARGTFDNEVEALTLTAMDGFKVEFDKLPGENWILVTHHDGEEIGLRDKGPLRLVERDYGERDTENLRLFNNWIWMITHIEGAP
ncbi:hypothetical protein [Vreelandella salicampi]|uniref:Uncharacterized protein n=1 Tax=Vreelandella salicampi TaxID=1449798 RepID=A0A7Z0LN87_9GAMM|nr:hypothetical protein [Halomonas salicampi]NYS62008.1 hypothetical protein [Halomonas salicampi]